MITNTIVVMDNAVMTYEQALADAGSAFLLKKKLESKELHKLTRGAYSKIEHPDPLVLAHVLYPEAVITMDSALYAHDLTDVIPDEVHLATSRSSTRIARPGYRQYFTEDALLTPGTMDVERDGGTARMYNRERMLVEVMRPPGIPSPRLLQGGHKLLSQDSRRARHRTRRGLHGPLQEE